MGTSTLTSRTPSPVPNEGAEMTKYFEGYRPRIYKDTRGNNTIGYGFNIDSPATAQLVPRPVLAGVREITPEESNSIFNTLYQKAIDDAAKFVGERALPTLTPQQFAIITDMAYNLGPNKLAGFKNMQRAIQTGDEAGVVREMMDSDWYKQTGRRARYHVSNYQRRKK